MASDAPPPPQSPRVRVSVVLWIALVISVLGGVLLYDLVLSAKKSKELMKKPPAAARGRFLGQGNDDDRPPPPRPSASSAASTSAPRPAASP